MEQIKHNHFGRANLEARTVKDITESAESIFNKVSVKAALDEMQARAIDSSLVIDHRGELLGTLSKNKMNREVGGFGQLSDARPPNSGKRWSRFNSVSSAVLNRSKSIVRA